MSFQTQEQCLNNAMHNRNLEIERSLNRQENNRRLLFKLMQIKQSKNMTLTGKGTIPDIGCCFCGKPISEGILINTRNEGEKKFACYSCSQTNFNLQQLNFIEKIYMKIKSMLKSIYVRFVEKK